MMMLKLTQDDFLKLRRLVYRGANPLLYTIWRCNYENANPEEFIELLTCYQNADGGFGHALEANCWNPNSSPYVTAMAIAILNGLFGLTYTFANPQHPVLQGILRYLASGAYATENGWLGLADLPSNNDYSHAPWFHYHADKESGQTDPKQIVAFILQYDHPESALYKKAHQINSSLPSEIALPDFHHYNPSKFICWEPLPTDIVETPASPLYNKYKELVEAELDGIVIRLQTLQELPIPGVDDVEDWPDLSWLDNQQVISCYASTCGFIIMQIEILRRFNRLAY